MRKVRLGLNLSLPDPYHTHNHQLIRSPTIISIPKSSESVSSSSSRSKTRGRLTRKDLRLHKLVFQDDALPDGTELAYFVRGQQRFPSEAPCCVINVQKVIRRVLEYFAFAAKVRSALLSLKHMRVGLLVASRECSSNIFGRRSEHVMEEIFYVVIIAQELFTQLQFPGCLPVFSCANVLSIECVSLPSIPSGTWYCKYCENMFQKEKFVEHNANAVAAGRIAGIDPLEQITKRCIRIVETIETDVGGCALCRGHGFSKSVFGPQTVILCDQCEKEYHIGCLKEHKMDDLKELPKGKWFCCMDCNRIHSALQNLVVSGEQKLQDSLLSIIKKKLEEKGSESSADLDIKWRLLSGQMASDDTRLLLSKAVSIFHDRFDPIADSNTIRNDLIPHMVYGRNVRDQEFGGMYCAILSVNSNIVCAGIIRIFGEEVAELPLVATSTDHQGQGYFQVLFSCIENLLGFLNVRNLVLPAADEAGSIWTDRFGFKKITEDELMNYRKKYQMMIFQGTTMLQKPVVRS
ncbi:hypothetical protein CsSME_00040620 [Camellia sinensis var. sinensis]